MQVKADTPPEPQAVRPQRTYVPLLVLVASLLLTALAAYLVDRTSKETEQVHYQALLDATAAEVRDRIAQRREAYVAILHGTAGLFAGDRYVPPEIFSEYVKGLKLEQAYPGVQGLGVIVKAAPGDLEKYEKYIASVGPNPHVWPRDPPRDVYYPILHLEPLDAANRPALGYDVCTDPVRRAALERARDEGTVGVTGKIRLVQDVGEDPSARAGFGMYYPIYRSGKLPPPATVEERRQRIIAFVASPFRADDFLRGVFPEGRPAAVEFDLYDGTELTDEHLLSRASMTSAGTRWPVGRPLTVDMGGRTWTLVFRTPRPPPAAVGVSRIALAVAAAGGAISVLLFALTRSQWRARRSAERGAADLRSAAVELRRRDDERLQLLAAERDARADAEAANRSKDEFLATLSHELRTPLNSILGWAQLLRMGVLPADEASQGLETIERNAKSQAQLVDDLLDLSRIIAGKLRVETRAVDLVAVVEGALDSARPAAEAKGISVVPVLDAHAGPVAGDAGRLQQVAWNLLSNAIKFTPRGGRVDVWLRSTGADAELTVSDSGAGIRAEFLPHVFDRLLQGDASSTRRHGGLGLGLAIVRHLVELHGGTVSADSRGEGRGSTFTVRLPRAAPVHVEAAASNKPGGRNDASHDTPRASSRKETRIVEGVRVLVVDDEPDARQVIRVGLEQRGATVETAASVEEALAALARHGPPDVLLSDIGMPGEDGYSLIGKVRQLPDAAGGNVPAVALTAYARAEDRDRALAAGYHAHLAKPVEPAQLAEVVAQLLQIARPAEAVGAAPTRL
jgi:signal transduction histidine kinase/ActR/RegA family two-component response regulator